MNTLARRITALYPTWWRHRYGKEALGIVEDLGSEPGTSRPRLIANLLLGLFPAWVNVKQWKGARVQEVPTQWGSVPRGTYRDVLGYPKLSHRSRASLHEGEVLLGTVQGWQGNRILAIGLRRTTLVFAPVVSMTFLLWASLSFQGSLGAVVTGYLTGFVLVLTFVVSAEAFTKSRNVVVAFSDSRILVFHRSQILPRTGRLLEEMTPSPATALELTQWGQQWEIGDLKVWLKPRASVLPAWIYRSGSSPWMAYPWNPDERLSG